MRDVRDLTAKTLCEQCSIIIDEPDKDEKISWVCNALLPMSSSTSNLENILRILPVPYTIMNEEYHIDKSYRDTYYTYFSNQHFQKNLISRRLSFFQGKISYKQFISGGARVKKKIEKSFMGVTVINPLGTGTIGRTLFRPEYVIEQSKFPIYCRLADFDVHIFGRKLSIRAFPFREQDQETMSCAEVTLLNIFEYYSTKYSDYRSVLPHEIIDSSQKHNHQRSLPSAGLTAQRMSRVLYEFGFSPRLYSIAEMEDYLDNQSVLKRWLYYYVESGIPLAVNLRSKTGDGPGHSMVCIGHGAKKLELVKKARRNRVILCSTLEDIADPEIFENIHPVINSADFFEDFVLVDDNSPIYQIRPFNNLSQHGDMKVESLAVPLYKRMFMDAPAAYETALLILSLPKFSVDCWAKDFLHKGEDIVIRLFMASSHSFKRHKRKHMPEYYAKEGYIGVPMPRFIWVAELYRMDDYDKGMAFGEIILDATSGQKRATESLIMIHYPGVILARDPEYQREGSLESDEFFSNEVKINRELEAPINGLFPGFNRNLSGFFVDTEQEM